jgi:hypothetical protein
MPNSNRSLPHLRSQKHLTACASRKVASYYYRQAYRWRKETTTNLCKQTTTLFVAASTALRRSYGPAQLTSDGAAVVQAQVSAQAAVALQTGTLAISSSKRKFDPSI